MTDRTISVDYLARVEGEGALRVRIHDRSVEEVELKIFEPPRFFEAFLRGRMYLEAPDITARICGICPVAYQMSACHAMERGLGITPGPEIRPSDGSSIAENGSRAMRSTSTFSTSRIFSVPGCDPDGPGPSGRGPAWPPARRRPGNAIMSRLGGREIHPVNVRVGGFYRCPSREELEGLRPQLEDALGFAEETVRLAARLTYPNVEEDYEFVSLRHPEEYPMNEGEVVSNRGLRIPASRFEAEFEEIQVPHSHALQSVRRGGGSYLVGAMARYALNGTAPPEGRRDRP